LRISVTALVRRGLTLNGGIDGSVQVINAENATLNGQAWIAGDLLMRGTPTVRLNGAPTYGGTLDATGAASPNNHLVTLNGRATLRHVVRRVDPIALPTVPVPSAPAGTRNVTINNASQGVGDWSTVRSLTLNANAPVITVPPGTYGTFTANGNNGFRLGVPGAVEPAVYELQGLVLNGNSTL